MNTFNTKHEENTGYIKTIWAGKHMETRIVKLASPEIDMHE